MDKFLIKKAKSHFYKTFLKRKNPFYPYLLRHVSEAEKWAKKILSLYPQADKTIVLVSVWLHDIDQEVEKNGGDHAVASEKEARSFLSSLGVDSSIIERVAHCVRSHRNRDVKPKTLEAKILAAADSASHFTDIVYVVHLADGIKTYVEGKIERDFRDVSIFPELSKEIEPLYRAWKELIKIWPYKG